jgi:hypothetical protein
MTYIEKLKDAIRQMHGCASVHLNSHRQTEKFRGAIVWDGTVEVFKLVDHPSVDLCYAWASLEGKDDSKTRFAIVLHKPPVDTPQKAVQAFIVNQHKSGQ